MRLPEFVTRISPVGETLSAITAGEQKLAEEIAEENGRLSVASADWEGLSLWEADYGLESGAGLDREVRQAKIRTKMSGACTLTLEYLKELCVTLGGADWGEVEELFQSWTVRVWPVIQNKVETDISILEECIQTLIPAHLVLDLQPCAQLFAHDRLDVVLSSATMGELLGELEIKEGNGVAQEDYYSVVTGAVLVELWCSV